MKTAGLNKTKLPLCLLVLSLFSLTGCPDGSSSNNETPAPYTNISECQNQAVPVGFPGNTECPYQGTYDPNRGYQPYSIQYNASVGAGFYIDFGWHYKDLCPQIGQLPVYQNGQLSYCSDVNPTFAQTDFRGFTQPNTGECLGEQYNPQITGCRASLQPTAPQNYYY